MKAQLSIEFMLSLIIYLAFLLVITFYLIYTIENMSIDNPTTSWQLHYIEDSYNLASIYSFSISFSDEIELFAIGNNIFVKQNEEFVPINIIYVEGDRDYV